MRIYVEANIGSGKSTLLNLLEDDYNTIKEPLDEWLNLTDGNENILDKFYKDPNRWAYTFQNSAFITRTQMLYDSIKEHGEDCIFITERSVATDRHVFAKML